MATNRALGAMRIFIYPRRVSFRAWMSALGH